jgi:hypothetical protein
MLANPPNRGESAKLFRGLAGTNPFSSNHLASIPPIRQSFRVPPLAGSLLPFFLPMNNIF